MLASDYPRNRIRCIRDAGAYRLQAASIRTDDPTGPELGMAPGLADDPADRLRRL